jgi:hypothetical protein
VVALSNLPAARHTLRTQRSGTLSDRDAVLYAWCGWGSGGGTPPTRSNHATPGGHLVERYGAIAEGFDLGVLGTICVPVATALE